MGLPDGGKSFKIGLEVLIQYRRVTDSQPPSHVAVASTRYAYLCRAVKTVTKFCRMVKKYRVNQLLWSEIFETNADVRSVCAAANLLVFILRYLSAITPYLVDRGLLHEYQSMQNFKDYAMVQAILLSNRLVWSY